MIIEIRAFLNKDGSVRKVDIINTSRYNSDAHFRSVADSARRAVYICAPYSIFADKYADKYDKWNTMLLRFNPLDGQIRWRVIGRSLNTIFQFWKIVFFLRYILRCL